MPASDVIRVAMGEVSNTEFPPGSNRVKYWDEYDPRMQGQPWCCSGLWWVFKHAGESMAFFGGAKTASCTTLYRWYKEQGQTAPKSKAQPGDIVMLNFHGTNACEHCGLVVDKGEGNWIQTVEFNTSPGLEGSQDNGGCVALKIRTMAQVVGVCRPKYKENEMPKTDYDKHWAKSDIEWAVASGYIKGYPDGSFHPDDPITRAESITVIRRVVEALGAEIEMLRAELEMLRKGG